MLGSHGGKWGGIGKVLYRGIQDELQASEAGGAKGTGPAPAFRSHRQVLGLELAMSLVWCLSTHLSSTVVTELVL